MTYVHHTGRNGSQLDSAPRAAQVRTYCGLCGVKCPAIVTVEGDTVVKLEPDRGHPRGGAVCGKGRAAPEINVHAHRVDYPLRRTRPKTSDDPGWERCSWDDALAEIAARMIEIRETSGPEAVAFNRGTGSGTGLREVEPWLIRLANHFGSPNMVTHAHLCNWPVDVASLLTWGVDPLPMPDTGASNCIVLWGHNPNATLLSLAQDVARARSRGARLVVVDPRRVGLANKADHVLQVRPGTDAALALALIHLLIEHHWFDERFVREWTNAPFLVRDDTGRLLRADEIDGASPSTDSSPVALDQRTGTPVPMAKRSRGDATESGDLLLRGSASVDLRGGRRVTCRPVLELLAGEAARCNPGIASAITGVPETAIRETAQLIASNRPVSHYMWNGVVQHTNSTQTCRAIEVLFALLGDHDAPGGNVPRRQPVSGEMKCSSALPAAASERRLGQRERPLGPAVIGHAAAPDLYDSILTGEPYRVRGLFALGGNILMANADPHRGREALQALEFFAQAELFLTPTSQYADIVLPAADFLECEALYADASGVVQRRPRVVAPLHQRRADVDIIFDLACRLGLGEHFANGEPAAAYDRVLAPFGLSWDGLREQPHGAPVAPPPTFRGYADEGEPGQLRGFTTPSGRVELYSEQLAACGQAPVPAYEEPAQSQLRTPDLAREFPLVLTNAKRAQYLHTQHRGIAKIRKAAPQPVAEVHPDTAATFGVEDEAWMLIETPRGRARAKARVTSSIVAGVVCANHGWWEACEELGLPALDPFSESGANVNLLVHNDVRDPVSGSVPHRSSLCRIRPVT
jgi:anaerobic selenocysteine-containing dehydrogenase